MTSQKPSEEALDASIKKHFELFNTDPHGNEGPDPIKWPDDVPNAEWIRSLKRQELEAAYAIDRPALVVEVRKLLWDGQTFEDEVCAAEPYLGPRYAVLSCPEGGFLVRTGRGAGYFDGSRRHETVEAAKAACEAQWQNSVRLLLTATTRDEVERGDLFRSHRGSES